MLTLEEANKLLPLLEAKLSNEFDVGVQIQVQRKNSKTGPMTDAEWGCIKNGASHLGVTLRTRDVELIDKFRGKFEKEMRRR